MKPLLSLISMEQLEKLASRSNFRYGQEIAKNGKIHIEKSNTFNIIATVQSKNKNTRTVELSSTSKGFRWKCTCTGRKDLFCNHCVAVGLFAINDIINKKK
jgi:uncharacterized Zn finger protein